MLSAKCPISAKCTTDANASPFFCWHVHVPQNSALLSYQTWVLTYQDTAQPPTDPNLGPGGNTALSATL